MRNSHNFKLETEIINIPAPGGDGPGLGGQLRWRIGSGGSVGSRERVRTTVVAVTVAAVDVPELLIDDQTSTEKILQ